MPKTRSFQLVNPIIEGTFKDVYDAKKPINAADDMWKNFSQHIVSHVPKFMFTMRDLTSDKMHHFEVLENKSKNSYNINELGTSIDKNLFTKFSKQVDEYESMREQKGGNIDDDSSSSSSSSSSSDIYPMIRRTSPIALFHYSPGIYYLNNDLCPSIMNPELIEVKPVVACVRTPIFTPIFRPRLGTFVSIWP